MPRAPSLALVALDPTPSLSRPPQLHTRPAPPPGLPQVFSRVGDVKRIVMGLDKHKLTPCGFCFVVYYTREDTEDCVK